eukprot:SAG31_NODE_7739_length_1606_cov_0.978766_1_plen_218_part_10
MLVMAAVREAAQRMFDRQQEQRRHWQQQVMQNHPPLPKKLRQEPIAAAEEPLLLTSASRTPEEDVDLVAETHLQIEAGPQLLSESTHIEDEVIMPEITVEKQASVDLASSNERDDGKEKNDGPSVDTAVSPDSKDIVNVPEPTMPSGLETSSPRLAIKLDSATDTEMEERVAAAWKEWTEMLAEMRNWYDLALRQAGYEMEAMELMRLQLRHAMVWLG